MTRRTADECPTHDPVVAALGLALGEDASAAAHEAGGHLSPEQAAAEASGEG
ncbi:MAG TPA: hypothetical protein VLW53_21205 [Candidatus Eisenbacteria bacterium]|nr:hypothetical protein [Candidatus Eisenbacteria bacterium]